MTGRPTIPDDVRAAVLEDVRAARRGEPGHTVRAIAARHGVAKATVGKIAKENGLADAWTHNTERTAAATTARNALVAAKRAALQEEHLDAARDLLAALNDDVTEAMSTPLGIERVTLRARPVDQRNRAQASSACTQAAITLARLEAEQSGHGETSNMLRDLVAGMRARRAERDRAEHGEQAE